MRSASYGHAMPRHVKPAIRNRICPVGIAASLPCRVSLFCGLWPRLLPTCLMGLRRKGLRDSQRKPGTCLAFGAPVEAICRTSIDRDLYADSRA